MYIPRPRPNMLMFIVVFSNSWSTLQDEAGGGSCWFNVAALSYIKLASLDN